MFLLLIDAILGISDENGDENIAKIDIFFVFGWKYAVKKKFAWCVEEKWFLHVSWMGKLYILQRPILQKESAAV